jgi:hypothetical protein
MRGWVFSELLVFARSIKRADHATGSLPELRAGQQASKADAAANDSKSTGIV